MSFELLSEPIRKYIRDRRWESLRPIQTAAIQKILSTSYNYILASRTASGKTEAAFLPILSKVDFNERGVQVLYISPLIALISDQFYRIEELCKYLDVEVTKWHGEANQSKKDRLIRNPKGIVLITPESLEAMFVNAPYNVNGLFFNLKYLVIDEIHSFIGSDRGAQLKSILFRLQQFNSNNFSIVGLSATIGDYNEAKRMTGDEMNTKVLLDRTAKEIETHFRYFDASIATELPLELINDLYSETKGNKVLIFPNSRGKAEEIAVKLKKYSEKLKGHSFYFTHHSSIDRELREYVEHFAKFNQRNNFCISCTSTLELGIDIGTVDKVVQVDATYSIASLIQRVGRSGRRDGEKSVLFIYATNKWSLLQSLACWLLYEEGFIEPVSSSERPYDILLHQMLSVVKQQSGCRREDLVSQMKSNFAFKNILPNETEEIVDELLRTDLFEWVEKELIIGVTGEKMVNSREFYSVFKSEPNLKVVNSGKTIGEIPFSPRIKIDENILLAARIWKIIDLDFKSGRIEVVAAKDGERPMFFGTGGAIHSKIRQKMFDILFEATEYPELDQASNEIVRKLREEFSKFPMESLNDDRPIIYTGAEAVFFTFQGTKVNRSLNFLLGKTGLNCSHEDQSCKFEIPINESRLQSLITQLQTILVDIDLHLENAVRANPSILGFSKWGRFLPIKFQVEILKEKYFDFEGVKSFLENVRFVTCVDQE